MTDRKLLIILICVIVVQSVMTLTHPAYRYYRSQAQNLRNDYLKFEKQVRDDFVPAITNFVQNVPRATLTKNEITKDVITKDVITKDVITKDVITKSEITQDVIIPMDKPPFTEILGIPFSVNDKMGFNCNGFYYFEGDTFMGSEIISIDGAGFRLANGYVKFTKDVITDNVITKDVNTKNVNDDNIVRQYPDVWFGDYHY